MTRQTLGRVILLAATIVASATACGPAQQTVAPRASSSAGGESTPAPGRPTGGGFTPGAGDGGGGGGGQGSGYTAGAGRATVLVAGTSHELTGGTCKVDSTVLPVFELVIGTIDDPEHLDVYVADMSTPIHDGDYSGGLTLVTVGVGGQSYAVPARVTLTDGLTKGSFTGRSAGNSPVDVSGTFTC